MKTLNPCLGLSLAVLALTTACATRASMAARYDESLQHWRGATRADLVAHWGPPQAVRERTAWNSSRTCARRRRQRGLAARARAGRRQRDDGGMPAFARRVPARCTTRFELHGGRVAGWTFDGLACGAPG